MPHASSARWSAAVALLTASACFAPSRPAIAASNACAFAPVVNQPERSTSTAAAISRSPMEGRWNGIESDSVESIDTLGRLGVLGAAGQRYYRSARLRPLDSTDLGHSDLEQPCGALQLDLRPLAARVPLPERSRPCLRHALGGGLPSRLGGPRAGSREAARRHAVRPHRGLQLRVVSDRGVATRRRDHPCRLLGALC